MPIDPHDQVFASIIREHNPQLTEGEIKFLDSGASGLARKTLKMLEEMAKNWNAYSLARMVLGQNFVSPEEITAERGQTFAYSDDQLSKLSASVPNLGELEWCRDHGYTVVPGPPESLSFRNSDLSPEPHARRLPIYQQPWYLRYDEDFSHAESARMGWYKLQRQPRPESFNKKPFEQLALLSKDEALPHAIEAMWFDTVLKAVRGERLLAVGTGIRTASLAKNGEHVTVVRNAEDQLRIDRESNRMSFPHLGILALRRTE